MTDVWWAGKCIGPNVWFGPHEICDSQGSGGERENDTLGSTDHRVDWLRSLLERPCPRRPIRLSYLFRDGPGYLNFSIAQLLQLSISRVFFYSRFIK